MPDDGGCEVPKSKETDGGLDDVRQSLVEKLNEVDEELEPYKELVEKQERLASALAALDGGKSIKKRVKWEQVAEYVDEHPGSKPAEIAAALEVPTHERSIAPAAQRGPSLQACWRPLGDDRRLGSRTAEIGRTARPWTG